jgi:glucose-1-phosphate adenylyltransferase
MELICGLPSFSLNHSRTVLTRRLDLPLPVLSHEGMVINSLPNPGCVIKGRVENSILSPGVYVDEQAEVRDSVLMTNAYVGYPSIVDTCVIDEEVNIRKLCYVGFGKRRQPGGGDLTVLGKGVAVPSHTAIGRNCTVFPNVDMSGLIGKLVASGSILSQRGSVTKIAVKKGGGK